jgi:hypothetical protein
MIKMIRYSIEGRIIDLLMVKKETNLKLPFLLVFQPEVLENGRPVTAGRYDYIFKDHLQEVSLSGPMAIPGRKYLKSYIF